MIKRVSTLTVCVFTLLQVASSVCPLYDCCGDCVRPPHYKTLCAALYCLWVHTQPQPPPHSVSTPLCCLSH